MVDKKMFAIRRKNGITRIVQVNKTPSGKKVYASDKRKCAGKTFKTKTMAKSALSKRKTPNSAFGRRGRGRGRSKSRGRKRSRSKSRRRRAKKFNFWNKYYVCPHPDDPYKIKVCPAARVRLNGETYQLVKVKTKSAYNDRPEIRRLLHDNSRLFNKREQAQKYATTVSALEMAGVNEVSELLSPEIFKNLYNHRRASFRGVRPGKLNKYSSNKIDPNIYRSTFARYEDPKEKSILYQPRKSRYRPRDLSIDVPGRATGAYGPLGLYTRAGRKSLAAGEFGGFGRRRTNYGFSRYF